VLLRRDREGGGAPKHKVACPDVTSYVDATGYPLGYDIDSYEVRGRSAVFFWCGQARAIGIIIIIIYLLLLLLQPLNHLICFEWGFYLL